MAAKTRAAERKRPRMTSLELPPELKAGLDAVWTRDGIRQSEQIRRAIRAWLDAKGIVVDAPQPTRSNERATIKRGRR